LTLYLLTCNVRHNFKALVCKLGCFRATQLRFQSHFFLVLMQMIGLDNLDYILGEIFWSIQQVFFFQLQYVLYKSRNRVELVEQFKNVIEHDREHVHQESQIEEGISVEKTSRKGALIVD